MKSKILYAVITIAAVLAACREEEVLIDIEKSVVTTPEFTDIDGFYLLNEGKMGNNKSTLDYFDYGEGTYYKNI